MLDNLKKYNIILASNSPRRREILSGLDIDFVVKTKKNIDESFPETLQGGDIPAFIAQKKANAYDEWLNGNTMIITADTIVWDGQGIMEKPKDLDDARRMLRRLSGETHTAYTAVTVNTRERKSLFVASTEVTFAELRDADIDYYVDRYKPLDKAGAYGVQEWIGYIAVKNIQGSFYNVMGLPAQRLWEELKSY